MSQYCDSKLLEKNWFEWLVSSSVPNLEKFRAERILWTRVLEKVKDIDGKFLKKNGQCFVNPCSSLRLHCLALPVPVFFKTRDDIVPSTGFVFRNGKRQIIDLDFVDKELNLESDCWLHDLDNPGIARCSVIPNLINKGYIMERPASESWHAVLNDINNMCFGIATKFNPSTEEEHSELSQDALLQVMNKLVNRKLVFTPGRAPVFNLLTTTIFRCMYSIQNKKKNQRNGMNKLINDMQAGTLPDNVRSFRAGMYPKMAGTLHTR